MTTKAAAVSACEEKAKYPQQAIAHLQEGDRAHAISTIEESFEKCAAFSESCSKELASKVVQNLEFSGAAVSDNCKQSIASIQKDQKKMQEVEKCEKEGQHTENVLVALSKNDLSAAVGAAQTGIEKCMGLSDKCAGQIAPVFVNQIVMRALVEQKQQKAPASTPMTTVFARTSATVLAFHPQETLRGAHRPPKQFVSRFIMELAR